MHQSRQTNSSKPEDDSNKTLTDQSGSSDQNIVNGTVEKGGIVIQGSEARVEIHQHFGDSSSEAESLDLAGKINFEYFEPETILIPEGSFWMGSPLSDGIPGYEAPKHQVMLPAYRIGKYPVTNAQYEIFIRDTHRSVAPEMGWDGLKVPTGSEKLPVTCVTWYDAMDYCQWLSEKTARKYSLPNEAQWEKACRAGKQSIYPWGDDFDPDRCNHGKPTLAPVDAYPAQNEYGCFDLVGNVRQWTSTLWGEKRIAPDPRYAYPWKDDGRNDINANRQVRRVMRGSSTKEDVILLRCSARSGQTPDDIGLPGTRNGFRVVMNV